MNGVSVGGKAGFLCFLMCVGLAGACGGPGAGEGDAGLSSSLDRNVLTEADLEGLDDLDAYQAIRRLKPLWLRYRGQSVLEGPGREGLRIYTDGTFYGDAETLSQIRIRNVMEIRFLDARQATLRFGTDHSVGALLIKTRR